MNEPDLDDGPAPADRRPESGARERAPTTPRGHAPVSALRGERERRQAAERELAALRQNTAAPETETEPFTALNSRFHDSEARARARFGHETMDQVQAWTAARMRHDPQFARAVLSHDDPYGFALAHHAEAPAPITGSGDEGPPEDRYHPVTDHIHHPHAAKAAHHNPSTPPAPRSLVSAPSAGGVAHTPQGPGQAFDALFKG